MSCIAITLVVILALSIRLGFAVGLGALCWYIADAWFGLTGPVGTTGLDVAQIVGIAVAVLTFAVASSEVSIE